MNAKLVQVKVVHQLIKLGCTQYCTHPGAQAALGSMLMKDLGHQDGYSNIPMVPATNIVYPAARTATTYLEVKRVMAGVGDVQRDSQSIFSKVHLVPKAVKIHQGGVVHRMGKKINTMIKTIHQQNRSLADTNIATELITNGVDGWRKIKRIPNYAI